MGVHLDDLSLSGGEKSHDIALQSIDHVGVLVAFIFEVRLE